MRRHRRIAAGLAAVIAGAIALAGCTAEPAEFSAPELEQLHARVDSTANAEGWAAGCLWGPAGPADALAVAEYADLPEAEYAAAAFEATVASNVLAVISNPNGESDGTQGFRIVQGSTAYCYVRAV